MPHTWTTVRFEAVSLLRLREMLSFRCRSRPCDRDMWGGLFSGCTSRRWALPEKWSLSTKTSRFRESIRYKGFREDFFPRTRTGDRCLMSGQTSPAARS